MTDSSSSTYQDAGDWIGILFGVYNLISAFYAFALPYIAKKIGRKRTHCYIFSYWWTRLTFNLHYAR